MIILLKHHLQNYLDTIVWTCFENDFLILQKIMFTGAISSLAVSSIPPGMRKTVQLHEDFQGEH